MLDTALAKINVVTQNLQKVETPEQGREVESMAQVLRAWTKEHDDRINYIDATYLYFMARRRTTELIKPHIYRGGNGSNQHESKGIKTDTLADFNLTKLQWHRRCQELEIPQEDLDEYFDMCRAYEDYWPSVFGLLKDMAAEKREVERAKLAAAGAKIKQSDKWHIYHGDIAMWNAPRQYDFIITDPPYKQEYLPFWEILAQRAGEWLKPNGMLIAMTPHFHLDKIMKMMEKHLHFYWIAAYLVPGETAGVAQRRINPQWKPLLIYAPANYSGKTFIDVFTSGENDKKNHDWGQSISGMMSIISGACLPGQYILDPFCGAGTTGVAAIQHGCLFDGLDRDIRCVNISKERLNDKIRKIQ